MRFVQGIQSKKKNYRKLTLIFITILLSLIHSSVFGQLPKNNQLNTEQANLMISFLSKVDDEGTHIEYIDELIDHTGSELIIAQMNLYRSVSKEQYQILMSSLHEDEFPEITPIDSSRRSIKGVRGLKQVWNILKWSMNNQEILQKRLDIIKQMDVYQKARNLALSYLPDSVNMNPGMYVVIGGRAGAAALSEDAIYYDLGKMSRMYEERAEEVTNAFLEMELVDFFAHEMHHIGLSMIRDKQNYDLQPGSKEHQLLSLIDGLVAEGSATYLVSGQRDVKNIPFYDAMGDPNRILQKYEEALLKIMKGEIKSEKEYENIRASFAGSLPHVAGSFIFKTIDEAFGLEKAMECIEYPEKLLMEYNQAVVKLESGDQTYYSFKQELAEKLYKINIHSQK